MTKKKVIRSFFESLFLGIGLYYLFSILSSQRETLDQINFSDNYLNYSLAILAFLLIYFYTIFSIDYITKKHHPENYTDNFMMLYSATSLSSLGKYIPGKIWSFLAFANLGKKMGLPISFLSSVFLINLFMSIATAFSLLALRLVDSSLTIYLAGLTFIIGFVIWDRFIPLLESVPWLIQRGLKLPRCASLFWSIQWLSAFTSGLGYHLIAVHFNPDRLLDFSTLTSYYLSYIAGFLAFFMPAGIGIREYVISTLDGSHEALATILVRVITVVIDLLLSIPAILFFLYQLKKTKT